MAKKKGPPPSLLIRGEASRRKKETVKKILKISLRVRHPRNERSLGCSGRKTRRERKSVPRKMVDLFTKGARTRSSRMWDRKTATGGFSCGRGLESRFLRRESFRRGGEREDVRPRSDAPHAKKGGEPHKRRSTPHSAIRRERRASQVALKVQKLVRWPENL